MEILKLLISWAIFAYVGFLVGRWTAPGTRQTQIGGSGSTQIQTGEREGS